MNENQQDEDAQHSEKPTAAEISPEAVVVEPFAAAAPKAHKSKKLILSSIAVVAVALIASGAFLAGRQTETSKTASVADAPNALAKTMPAPAAHFRDTYLQTAQPITPPPKFFTADASTNGQYCDDGTTTTTACAYKYKKIGTTKDGKAIIVVNNGSAGMDYQEFIALETAPGAYSILGNYGTIGITNPDYLADFQKQLTASTRLDTVTKLPDLAFDQNITYKGMALTTRDSGGYSVSSKPLFAGLIGSNDTGIATNASKINKLGKYGVYDLDQVTALEGPSYKVETMHLVLNQVFEQSYLFDSTLNNDATAPTISWANNAPNTDTFSYRNPGCGNTLGYLVAKNITAGDLTKIGTGPNGQALYSLPTNSALFQDIYNNDYGTGDSLDDANLKNLTADQFQAKHGFFLAKDGLGEYVVYLNTKFITGGGCGKPVVYLYPTKTQSVNVAVGANVQKSVPNYPTGGWKQVLAQPNGQLRYQGKTYPNLYWEGTGHGQYPIVDAGTVVASKDAVITIKNQLAEQGLNSTEIKDFMDYWQPRLPHTAYVRLTWFNTAQMNELAPLSIAPKPMTTIRVFLDFQGLNHWIALPAQHFSATPRLGFTAVEWGGLDRSF